MSFLGGCPSIQSSWIGGIEIDGRKLSDLLLIEAQVDNYESLLTAILWTYCLWSGTTCFKGRTEHYVRYAVNKL
jgi:hypothetical protein